MLAKRKARDKDGGEEGKGAGEEGPLRMSDRKSGDANMFGDRIQTCSVHINKLHPNLTKAAMSKAGGDQEEQEEVEKPEEAERVVEHVEKDENEDSKVKEESRNTLSVIKGEESEKKILQIVESTEFDEFDITTKLDILDTSKKKIEEIKRKSQEQINSQTWEPDSSENPSGENEEIPTKPEGTIETSEVKNDEPEQDPDIKEDKEDIKSEKEKVTNEKWKEGEKILCFHGPLIYEAKIQRVEMQNGIAKYFIHYRGWNKNWDEWVPEARMLKFSEPNVEIQKDLCSAHEAKEKAKKVKQRQEQHVFAVPKTPSPVPAREERGRRKAGSRPKRRQAENSDDFCLQNGKQIIVSPPDSTVESEEQFKTKLEIKIKIPDELKPYIVDDWEQICGKRRLCILPAKITADQMISEYTRAKTLNKADKLKNNKEKAILEVTAGVREYFNVMLPSQLLYKLERPQYDQLVKAEPGLVPSKTYGVVHLLRLFTKLGEILIYTPLSEKSVGLLLFYINDMLMYMKRNASLLFSQADYTQETPV